MGELDLFSLEKEQLWGHLTSVPSAYGCHQEDRAGLFMLVDGGRIKENTHKLKQEVQSRYETFPPCSQARCQRGCAGSILGGSQDPTGYITEHPGLML